MAYTKTVWLDRAVGWARRFWMNWDNGNDKNLLPPFTDWILHANAVATSDYLMTLTAAADGQASYIQIPVIQNTAYVFSYTRSANAVVGIYTGNGSTTIVGYSTSATITFNSGSNSEIRVYLKNANSTTGVSTFTNPQLELGTTATAFTPKKLYTITQSPGTVTQAGTPVNAANLNKMEQGIADAHTPSIVLDLIKQVDGAGSGLDADTLDGRNGLQYAFTQDKLTLAQMQDMNRTSGIYTTTGTGIPNPDGSVFLGGWWHIYHSYHGADGYAVQVAYPYGHEGNSTPYWRNASGTVWSKWKGLGGMTDIQATHTRGASWGSLPFSFVSKANRTWHTIVDIQNKKGMLMQATFSGSLGTYDQSESTYMVGGTIQFRLTLDDQVENIVINTGGQGFNTGFTFITDQQTYGGDSGGNQNIRQDPIYFARNMKLEIYGDPTQAGYTGNPLSSAVACRYALHIGT